MVLSQVPKMPPFDPALFSLLLEYRDGRLFYLERGLCHSPSEAYMHHWNRQFAGTEAFLGENDGYRIGSVFGIHFKAHHVVWCLFNGWPTFELDHIDRVRSNNRIGNLRPSNGTLNALNRSLRSDNKTGVTGVQLKPNGCYEVRAFGRYLGRAASLEQAIEMRNSATGA